MTSGSTTVDQPPRQLSPAEAEHTTLQTERGGEPSCCMCADRSQVWIFEHTKPQIAVQGHLIHCAINTASSRSIDPEATRQLMFTTAVQAITAATDGRPPRMRSDEVAISAITASMASQTPLCCHCDSPTMSLDSLSEDLAASGLDGEELIWAVIGFEAQNHIKLIWHETHKIVRRHPDRSPEDLFGWGWLGLRTALRAYDPALGFRFATYACQRISGAIRDGIRSEQPLPKRLTTFARKVSRIEEELVGELGRSPTLEEVALRLHEKVDTLRILPRLIPAAPLEDPNSSTSTTSWPSTPEEADPAEIVVQHARADDVRRAIAALPAEEATVVNLLYFEGLSIPQIAARMSITPRQVRSRMNRAHEQLVLPLSCWA